MGNHVYIVSIAPYVTTTHDFPWKSYRVPAAPKGGYAKVRVEDGVASLYTGEGRYVPIAQQARAVAEDIIRNVEDHGVFITENEEPTQEELQAAEKRRLAFLHRQIDEADASWRQFGNRSLISTHAQFAADHLGLKREWHSDVTEMVSCPSCMQRILPGTVKCGHCGAILDMEKAKQFFPEAVAAMKSLQAKDEPEPAKGRKATA